MEEIEIRFITGGQAEIYTTEHAKMHLNEIWILNDKIQIQMWYFPYM